LNYYERHLGDYAKDTAHLSMLEHGAYSLLMDRYYATEQGIPADQAHRVARARTKEEKAAVDAVLAEFFTLNDGVWTKNRIEEEIAKAAGKITAARENGKRGGRPKKNPDQTQEKPSGFPLGSETETQTKALQTPDTRHQESRSPSGSRLPPDWELPNDWLAWAQGERPDLDIAQAASRFADYWHGKAGKEARKVDWLATWRNWVRGERISTHPPRHSGLERFQ